jgi:putative addiction module killer protein
MRYDPPGIEVLQAASFVDWLEAVADPVAVARVVARIRRAEGGALGDWKSLGNGLSEMRIDHGPGYRLYFARRAARTIVMLAGGVKDTQARDIRIARSILDRMRNSP